MPKRFARNFWTAAVLLIALIGVTLLPLCGALFGCGCTLSHGAAHCNVHAASGPHCPWCAGGGSVVLLNFAVILAGSLGCAWAAQRRWGGRIWVGLLAGLIAYLLCASVAGFVTARVLGYPIWWGLRI